MAYRRRQGITRASTFKEETHHPPPDHDDHHHQDLPTAKTLTPSLTFTPSSSSSSSSFSPLSLSSSSSSSSSSSLAAQAIRASASQSHRESSLPTPDSFPHRSTTKVFDAYGDASTRNDSKGFWGVLAHKAKSILEDDNVSRQFDAPPSSRFHMSDTSTGGQSYSSSESFRKMDNPTLRKGLDKLTSSLNQIGDTFEKAFEEGRTIVENKTADIIQETRKLQIRRKGNVTEAQMQAPGANSTWQQPLMQPAQPQNQMNHETQLKASRDVAMATAAKAKLLLRELKTVKADLAFAKQRCSQLEEENKILRESREKGGNPADDDLIRLQLETLLAEKARLAHENSVYARENRFLREIVEYHQLTMQDVVYLDEGSEEVTEVYPITRMLSITPPTPASPPSPSEMDTSAGSPLVMKEILPVPSPPQEGDKGLQSEVKHNSGVPLPKEDNTKNITLHDQEDEKSTPQLKEEMQN